MLAKHQMILIRLLLGIRVACDRKIVSHTVLPLVFIK
jgi:hypothetical protein